MTKGKPRKTTRAGTSGGARRTDSSQSIAFPTRRKASRSELPDDLPDAAEAALDDLLSGSVPLVDEAELDPPTKRPARKSQPVIDAPKARKSQPVIAPVQPRAATASVPSLRPPTSPQPVVRQSTSSVPSLRPSTASVPPLRPASTTRPPPPPPPRRSSEVRPSVPPPPPRPSNDSRPPPIARRPGLGVEDSHIVGETLLPEVPSLKVAVFEDSGNAAALQAAIVIAGHTVALAESGKDGAQRVISAVRGGLADVVIASLADPGGAEIVDAALALEPRRPIVIAALGGDATDAIRRGSAAGADLVAPRPHDVERLAPLLHAAARLAHERRLALAAKGSELVLRAKLDEISDPEPRGLQQFEMFQRVLELEIKRARRFEYPLSVALFAVEVAPPPPPAGIRGILRARAGNALIHTIRDIDLATQLDHERFLVLLPYTDLTGAAAVARRVIAAVSAGDAVISAGRSFPPRVVGAVSGGKPGNEISFGKLMKQAARALEQARRDGAELAVQP